MSDAFAKEPGPDAGAGRPDDDAWATACAEDLAAERARQRATGAEHRGQVADGAGDVRRLFDQLAGQAGRVLPGSELLVHRARSAVDPLLDRHADVLDHLARAGDELAAAARAAFAPDTPARRSGDGPPPSPADQPDTAAGNGPTEDGTRGGTSEPGERS